MNLVDLVLVIIVAAGAFEGFRRGLLRQALELGGIVLAFFLAARFGAAAGSRFAGIINIDKYLETITVPPVTGVDVSGAVESAVGMFSGAIGYLMVFMAVVGISKLLAMLIGNMAKLPLIGPVNRFGGLALGLAKSLLICIVLVWVASLLAGTDIPMVSDAVEGSWFSQRLLALTSDWFSRVKDMLGVEALGG